MKHLSPERDDRASLKALLAALDASETTLRRDLVRGEGRAGNWAICGKLGHVYPDGDGYLLCVVGPTMSATGRREGGPTLRHASPISAE